MTLKRSRMHNFCTYYCEQCSVSGLFSVALLRLTKTRWKDGLAFVTSLTKTRWKDGLAFVTSLTKTRWKDGLAFVTSVRQRSVRAERKKGTTSKEHAQKDSALYISSKYSL